MAVCSVIELPFPESPSVGAICMLTCLASSQVEMVPRSWVARYCHTPIRTASLLSKVCWPCWNFAFEGGKQWCLRRYSSFWRNCLANAFLFPICHAIARLALAVGFLQFGFFWYCSCRTTYSDTAVSFMMIFRDWAICSFLTSFNNLLIISWTSQDGTSSTSSPASKKSHAGESSSLKSSILLFSSLSWFSGSS